MEKNPTFFKIIISDLHSQRMKIPPDFVKNLTKDFFDQGATMKATIKGEFGSWLVEIRKTTNEVYFEVGWEKIMKDNFLGDYELLLFKYDGKMCFNMQIFDKSGIERLCAYGTQMKNQFEDHTMVKTSTMASYNVGSFSSDFPYFKISMRHYNVHSPYTLRLPVGFTNKHLPGSETGERKTIMIENLKKQVWELTAIPYQGSYMISKGWRVFVRANKLKTGDVCIFQYLGKHRLRVLVE